MKKSFVILILIGLASIALLNFLPKSNVGENNLVGGANRDMAEMAKSEDESLSHSPQLDEKQLKELNILKNGLNEAGKDNLPALEKLVNFFQRNTQLDSAAIYFEEYVKLNPNPDNWLKVAQLYFEAQTYALRPGSGVQLGEKAREYYQKVFDLNPNNLMVKTNLAMTYMESSNPMQGISMLREVIDQEPDYIPALFNLGILSIRSNQFGRGKERFEQILEIDPNNHKAALNLGYCLAELNEKEEAITILEKVIKLSKDSQEIEAAKSLIEEIKK